MPVNKTHKQNKKLKRKLTRKSKKTLLKKNKTLKKKLGGTDDNSVDTNISAIQWKENITELGKLLSLDDANKSGSDSSISEHNKTKSRKNSPTKNSKKTKRWIISSSWNSNNPVEVHEGNTLEDARRNAIQSQMKSSRTINNSPKKDSNVISIPNATQHIGPTRTTIAKNREANKRAAEIIENEERKKLAEKRKNAISRIRNKN
ncbi:MAG: hypothetical protein Ct9H90mP28_4180 [Paracoccaceae bacterium]|nr:MAG: hypothetical protein Ct9H90mP28_4180 [Paracoccaceae bacterium]